MTRASAIRRPSAGEAPIRSGAGRPPRVTRAQIAHAALEIGLHKATVRNVADKLGMSVPGLYHHVRTRQQLLDLAMEHVLAGLPSSWADDGPWRDKLLSFAELMFTSMVEQPDLITRVASGAIASIEYLFNLETFVAASKAHGLTGEQGLQLYRRLLTIVTGAAAAEAGNRAMRAAGTSMAETLGEMAAAHDADEFPEMRQLLHRNDLFEPDPLEPVRLTLDALLEQFERQKA